MKKKYVPFMDRLNSKQHKIFKAKMTKLKQQFLTSFHNKSGNDYFAIYKQLPKKERAQLLMNIIDWEILKKLKRNTKKYEESAKKGTK